MSVSIDRRTFLRLSSGAGLTGLFAGCGSRDSSGKATVAASSTVAVGSTTASATAAAARATFPALPARVPASLAGGSREELDIELRVLSGALPPALHGHVFMSYPVPERNGMPIFNGDGVIVRLDLSGSRVALKSRLAKTPCWYAEQATRGTRNTFIASGMAKLGLLGVRNQLNTAPVPILDGRLLVTYDAGRPYEIDPVSLELATPVGWNVEWRPALPSWLPGANVFPGCLGTAHPFWDDRTDEIFALNYGSWVPGAEFTHLLRWDGHGALERHALRLPGGSAVKIRQSAHQIAVSRSHVLVIDTGFNSEMFQVLNPNHATAQMPDTVVYLVRRADLRPGGGDVPVRVLTIPREIVHAVADYDDSTGIVLHAAHNAASDPSEWVRTGDVIATTHAPIRLDLVGVPVAAADLGVAGRHVIDATSAAVVDTKLFADPRATWGGPALSTYVGATPPDRLESLFYVSFGFHEELLTQRTLDLYASYKYRSVPVASLPRPYAPGALFRLDAASYQLADLYPAPPGRILGSPQLVPRPGAIAPHDGWIVATMVSDDRSHPDSSGDEIWVFDASDLAAGPLCRLGHPRLELPFTLHVTWLPRIAPRTASYSVPVRDDWKGILAGQPADVNTLFANHVFPHFP